MGRITASTPTFALYRAPAAMVVAGQHHDGDVFYAFLVEPGTGALRTLVWTSDTTTPESPALRHVVEL